MMPEILTESFCERCGTRYTFESAAPRKARRLGQFKTLSKGMKNWVLSDDSSLDEAMAAARNDEERELTSQQLDAFHSTFNFCMNCRQYTCANCWNGAEGRCLTCSPHLGQEILSAPFPEHAPFEPARIEAEAWPEVDVAAVGTNGNGHDGHPVDADPWGGAADVEGIEEFDAAARLAFLSGEAPAPAPRPIQEPPSIDELLAASPVETTAWPESSTSALVEDTPVVEAAAGEAEPEGIAAELDEPFEAVPEPIETTPAAASEAVADVEELPPTVGGRATAGAARTSDLLRRFRPGQSLDAELEAYEAELERQEAAAAAPAADLEPSVAFAAEPRPVAAAPELEPIAAEPEPVTAEAPPVRAEPEPVVVAAEPEPVHATAEPEPEPIAAAAEAEPEPIAAAAAAEPEPIAASAASADSAPSPDVAAPEPVREDRIEQPTWRIFAPEPGPPEAPATGIPGSGPAQPDATPPVPAPQWPVRPDQVESPAMALLANRGNGSKDAGLWAASTQELLAEPGNGSRPGVAVTGVQPCSNCGLSLSATARFCRRCGTRQA